MNEELIDEIAYQAGCHRHTYADTKNPDLDGFIINRDVLDKFAELIVRECANRVKDFYQEDEFTCYSASEEIKQHFGFE